MIQFIWSSWTGKSNLCEISIIVAKAGGRLERGTNNFGGDVKVLYIISGGSYRHVYVRAHGTQPLRPVYSLIVFKLYSIYKCNSVFSIKKITPNPSPKHYGGCYCIVLLFFYFHTWLSILNFLRSLSRTHIILGTPYLLNEWISNNRTV